MMTMDLIRNDPLAVASAVVLLAIVARWLYIIMQNRRW